MITRLGNCIARNLAASEVIPSEDIELYGYGFFLLLSYGLYLLFTIMLGTFLDILWQSILFYLLFSLLRRYAGGIHARTEWGCMLSTTASFTLSIIAIYSFNQTEHPAVAAVLLLTGCAIIVINHDGNVTICERLVDNPSFCVGNVNDEKIVDIWNGEKIEALTHPDPQKFQGTQCYACENFKKCITESGPCYARIQKVSSRIYDCDPFCVYALKKVRFH